MFSERKGYKPLRQVLQVNFMSTGLRNSLWNVVITEVLSQVSRPDYSGFDEGLFEFCQDLWHSYFKNPIDEIPSGASSQRSIIRSYFLDKASWYEVYDFLEWVMQHGYGNDDFMRAVNLILETEHAGYRLVAGRFVDITNEEELQAVDDAANIDNPAGVSVHTKSAVGLYKDKDYRNSFKESISAVEAMARFVTGDNKATLGEALKHVESKKGLHPALKSTFSSLYGFASDENGVRHAMIDTTSIGPAEARFFVVTCSAFINYLQELSASDSL